MSYATGQFGVSSLDSSRRTYDVKLGDKLHELWDPSATPFLVFLTKLRKEPTGDPAPRKLVHTSGYVDRHFFSGAAGTWSSQANGATTDNLAVQATKDGSDDVGFLIANMIVRIKTTGGDTVAIIDTVDTQQQIDLTSISSSPNAIADNDEILIHGTAFAQGADKATAVADTTTYEYTYTRIFKTVINITGTLSATELFGGDEYNRLEAQARGEHLVDIERALLFDTRASTTVGSDTIQTTYGMVSYIEDNSTTSSIYTPVYNDYVYDNFVDDMEAFYTKGGKSASNEKLALAGNSVVSFFSKIGPGKLWSDAQLNITSGMTEVGLRIMKVEHPHGTLMITKEPVLRGNSTNVFYKDYMVCVDMNNVSYRPLKGNGKDRDTHIQRNLPTTKDEYIDQFLTEAALHPIQAPTHALFKFQ